VHRGFVTAPQVCRVACRAFVTLTARWLPMTEIRRGLTEIQLSHNTVGCMTAINVKTHGAIGDGTSDDHAAVMAAIREAVEGGGGYPSGIDTTDGRHDGFTSAGAFFLAASKREQNSSTRR